MRTQLLPPLPREPGDGGQGLILGLSLSARKFKREKLKEGESLEDLDHVLDMDDVFWTWFSISGRYRPRTATTNADYDSAVFRWPV